MGSSNINYLGASRAMPSVKLTAEERVGLATLFMDEVLLHHDCLVKIGESMGVQTLADLCFLQGAIMRGTFIEHYRDSFHRSLT
jgi:hypothetical protein